MTGPEPFHEIDAIRRAVIEQTFGEEGRRWLTRLRAVERAAAEAWSLELGPRLPGGLLSSVRAVQTADGAEAILKVGAPWPRALHEAIALRHLDGRGVPRVLDSDDAEHLLLLERIRPGTLPDPDGRTATDVGAVLRRIHVPPPDGLPTLGEIVRRRLAQGLATGRTTARKAAWAEQAIARLERDPPPPRLVHGDFDHRNLLSCARRGLVAIDPLPCVGDPAYDAGSWVHAARAPGRRARLDAIAVATGLPRDRVRDWAAVVGVHG